MDEGKIAKVYPDDYRLGMIIHTKFRDFLMTVNIPPSNGEHIANFNYQFELNNFEEIRTRLEEYSELMTKAQEDLERLFNE